MNTNDYFAFDDKYCHPNPLDFLHLRRGKPRSSMESSDRQMIPECEPPFISTRRDSNRSRLSREPYSP